MKNSFAINGRYRNRRIAGVERYAREITKRLQGNDYRMIVPERPLGQFAGHLWEQVILPRKLGKNEALWSPANAGPWIVRRQVVTLHDAAVFDHPEWFLPSFAAWTRLSWKVLAIISRSIITVSAFSRERLHRRLNISREKIHVISNGVGAPFKPQPVKAITEARGKHGLDKAYFLFVGTHEPRKNLTTLLQAWERLGKSSHLLAIAGDKGAVFASTNDSMTNTPDTLLLGHIPDTDLPALYAGAKAVILPSLYEGFGLTVLEAMACGSPVIASSTSSFPEVAGEAALLVNPHDPKEISEAMRRIMDDPAHADALRERGTQRAAQFTWEKAALKTQSLLEGL